MGSGKFRKFMEEMKAKGIKFQINKPVSMETIRKFQTQKGNTSPPIHFVNSIIPMEIRKQQVENMKKHHNNFIANMNKPPQ